MTNYTDTEKRTFTRIANGKIWGNVPESAWDVIVANFSPLNNFDDIVRALYTTEESK